MKRCFFHTALQCEAKALIREFSLRRKQISSPFPIYENGSIYLIVSGVGRVLSAAGVSFLGAHLNANDEDYWINVGIAGHRTLPIGTSCLIHQIKEVATKAVFYPSIVFSWTQPTYSLCTVDQVEEEYRGESCYDMEASSFFQLANKFSPAEHIHSLKVISDNKETCEINAKKVVELIKGEIKQIKVLQEHVANL